jgi:hypothetical protein
MGECQCPLGKGLRLLQAAGQQVRLPQEETAECLKGYCFHCNGLFHRLREQRHGVGNAPAQGVRCPQGRSDLGEPGRKVRFPTHAQGPFEEGERPVQVALAEGQQADPMRGKYLA